MISTTFVRTLLLLVVCASWCGGIIAQDHTIFEFEGTIQKLAIERLVKKGRDKTQVTYREKNQEKTVFEWSNDGSEESVFTYNAKGQYLQEEHRRQDYIEWIDYRQRHKVRITSLDLRHVLWQKWHRSDTGWTLVTKKEVLRDQLTNTALDDYRACNSGISDADLNRRLQNIANIVPIGVGGSFSDEWIPGQPNLRIREDCGRDYPGGTATLASDLGTGINTGLACMDRLVQENKDSSDAFRRERANELRRMMRKAIGNFDPAAPKPFSIRCSTEGHIFGEFDVAGHTMMRAELCGRSGSHDAPAITINSTTINAALGANANHAKLSSYFFHELMHHTGYVHDHGDIKGNFDIVYAVQRCCFEEIYCDALMTMNHGQPFPVRRGTTVTE